ncbi:N-acetylglucosamine-6-phosphate deacetylase [Mycoplasmopsis pullorum]|uniref:N-acetylglucosamine-6-phosphate deacetylase n=1 Tax=Mycoplasmopsis pullorum TaxID=48003 RepID=A0A1L4FRK6_9BACT|nr:N-acetylglucosamine-6-phosphate deacetylase [Mycoplasmopsis pullorum]APJ38232.1 N-acetylglucosamine-6-phosphate deacetylase [Mycoplasmopsis pullorum]
MTIKDVKIINFDNIIECADVVIKDKKIAQIIPSNNQSTKILIPGFFDTHIHGFVGHDVMDSAEAVQKISLALAKTGVTSFYPTAMTNTWSKIIESFQTISSTEVQGAKIQGIHIEGPFLKLEKKGAHDPKLLLDANRANLTELIEAGNGKFRKISIDPLCIDHDNIQFLIQNNVEVSIGHSNAEFKVANEAFKSGATNTCHLWNAMSGVDSRRPGIAQAALMNNQVFSELICDFYHVNPETVKFTIQNKGTDKVVMISDAIKPAYGSDGLSVSGGIPVEKHGIAITLAGTNTIAGSGISLYDSFKNLIKIGYTIQEAVQMCSYNPAVASKVEQIGYIKENYYADFVLLDQNLNIEHVYVNGKEIQ